MRTGQNGANTKRTSTRKAVISKTMRVVDSETRRMVRDKRLAALETDNYLEEIGRNSDDDEAYAVNEVDEAKPKKKKAKQERGASKWASRKVKPFERILEESGYIAAGEYTEKSDYLSVNATSSYLPTRKFCSVCGCFGTYSCIRCGMRLCTVRCGNSHKETSCLKFSF